MTIENRARGWRHGTALALFGLLIAGTNVSAEETAPAPALDGTAALADLAVYDKAAEAADGWSRPIALGVVATIIDRDRISADEKDLIAELASGEAVTVTAADRSPLVLPAASADAVEVFEVFRDPLNMNDHWLKGPALMRKLVILSAGGQAAYQRVTNYCGSKFFEKWNESSLDDGYRAIRDTIMEAYNQLPDRETDPALNKQGRRLLYDAMVLVDNHVGGKIPQFIYDWIYKPEWED